MAATALITGSSGLIGSQVVAVWDIDWLTLATPRSHDDSGDLLRSGNARRLLERIQPEIVVHLAWVASGTPDYRASEDNERWADATLELEQACRQADVRFYGTGTVVEGVEPAPGDRYAAAKQRVRRTLDSAVRSGSIGWFQPAYVFDPERRRPRLVADALAARESGRPVVLRAPYAEHDFVHVHDVARGIVAAVRARMVGEVALGSGAVHRVCDVVAALGATWVDASTGGATVSHEARAADISRLVATGWGPRSTRGFFEDD